MQRAQQPGLGLGGHVTDLVEEQRAAIGLFELADCLGDGAGESALLVAEQLAFDQIGGDGRSVDCDERPGAAVAEFVNRLGHQLLAGAALAGNQHREIIAQHPRDHAVDALHRRAAPDQRHCLALAPRKRAIAIFQRGRARACGLAHGVDQLVEVERLGKIFEGFALASAHCGIERILGREHDHRHVGRALAHRAKTGKTIAVFENDVGQHHREPARRKLLVARSDAGAVRDGEALVLKRSNDHCRDRGIILDQQDRLGLSSGHGLSHVLRLRQVQAEMGEPGARIAVVADIAVHVAHQLAHQWQAETLA